MKYDYRVNSRLSLPAYKWYWKNNIVEIDNITILQLILGLFCLVLKHVITVRKVSVMKHFTTSAYNSNWKLVLLSPKNY